MMRIVSTAAVAALLCVSTAAQADYQTEKDDRNIGVMERAMVRVVKAPALFDGRRIVPGTNLIKLRRYIETTNSGLTTVAKHYRQLSAKGKQRPKVRQIVRAQSAVLAYIRAVTPLYNKAAKAHRARAASAAANSAAANKKARAICKKFKKEALTSKYRARMHYMIDLMVHGHGTLPSPKYVTEKREVLSHVAGVCARAEFTDVGAECGSLYRKYEQHMRKYEMAKWCKAAKMGEALIQKGVMNHVRGTLERQASQVNPERVRNKEGWIAIEGPVTYKTHMFFTKAAKKKIQKMFKPVFEAARITNLDDPELFKQQSAALDKLRAAVDELAPTWKTPGKRCRGYGCAFAKRTIKKWHRGASIKKVTQTRKGFKIYKNRYGIPTHRSNGGYVLFKLRGSKWCQLRSFTHTEKYRGGGRFKRAKGVRMGYARFQRCK